VFPRSCEHHEQHDPNDEHYDRDPEVRVGQRGFHECDLHADAPRYFEEKFPVISSVEYLYHEAIVVRTRATAVHGVGQLTGSTGNSPTIAESWEPIKSIGYIYF
jgi:hypothetical protein